MDLRKFIRSEGGAGVNDNDVVFEVQRPGYDSHFLMSTGGAMDVFVSLDDANFATAPLSLIDLGAISNDPVLVTAAGRIYAFRGTFPIIRVLQNGATAVANAVLLSSNLDE